VDGLSYTLGEAVGLLLTALFAAALARALGPIVRRGERGFIVAAALLTTLAIVKTALLPFFRAEYADLRQFETWSVVMAWYGPAHAYDPKFACIYTPAYLYALWPAAAIAQHTGLNLRIMVELPLVIADYFLGLVVYAAARKVSSPSKALVASLAAAFNPALIYVSTVWGQNDSVLALVILLSVVMAADRRFAAAWALAAVAALIKAQGLILLPLLGWWTLITGERSDWWQGAGAGLATAILVIAPFQIGHPWNFIWDVYASSADFFPWGSVNAFNLMLALGGLVVSDSSKVFGPVSFFMLGTSLFGFVYAISGWITWRKRGDWFLFFSVFLVYLGMFTFETRMHERYLFYAVALMTPLVPTSRTIAALYAVLTVTLFLDAGYVFFNLLLVAGAPERHLMIGPYGRLAIAIANVAAFTVAAAYGILAANRTGLVGNASWADACPDC
jgi:Gpi18-like mannosyltransferase